MHRLNPWSRLAAAVSGLSLFVLAFVAGPARPAAGQAGSAGVTVYEGARLIIGTATAPIEDSAFVVSNGRFTQVGRAGQVQVPAGATRVSLAGKTVMPAIVDTHTHLSHDARGARRADLRGRRTSASARR